MNLTSTSSVGCAKPFLCDQLMVHIPFLRNQKKKISGQSGDLSIVQKQFLWDMLPKKLFLMFQSRKSVNHGKNIPARPINHAKPSCAIGQSHKSFPAWSDDQSTAHDIFVVPMSMINSSLSMHHPCYVCESFNNNTRSYKYKYRSHLSITQIHWSCCACWLIDWIHNDDDHVHIIVIVGQQNLWAKFLGKLYNY